MLQRVHVLTCTINKRNKKVGACMILGGGGVFNHNAIYIYIYIYIYMSENLGGGGHWPVSVVLMVSGPGRKNIVR